MLQDDIFYTLAIVDNDISFVRRCNVSSCSSITCGIVLLVYNKLTITE